jgi:hypothetical protein
VPRLQCLPRALSQSLRLLLGALNVAGWYCGVALGASLRGSRIVSDEDRLYRLASASVAAVTFVVLLLIGV